MGIREKISSVSKGAMGSGIALFLLGLLYYLLEDDPSGVPVMYIGGSFFILSLVAWLSTRKRK